MAAHPRRLLQQSAFSLMLAASPSVSFCAISTDSEHRRAQGDRRDPLLAVEGVGCWQVQTADGDVYELRTAELPSKLRREGTEVTLLGTALNQAGACRSGNVFVSIGWSSRTPPDSVYSTLARL